MIGRLKLAAIGTAVAAAVAAPGVMYYEGLIPQTYSDPVGIPTACYGETGAHIQPEMVFSHAECAAMLDASLSRHWAGIERCLGDAEVTVGEAAAVLSWAYNIGTGAACTSTLAKMVRAGVPGEVWCHQLTRWTKARKAGVVIELPGLVRRRQAELTMCLTGQWPAWVTS